MTDVIVMNWQELEVSKDSVRLLLREPTVERVILVDNGSTDGSVEYFSNTEHPKFTFLPMGENKGSSVARNRAIELTTAPYIWLLDGDIMYIKGSIEEYEKILDLYPDAYCVGQNSMELLNRLGHNGVTDPTEADYRMENDYTIEQWFPMAWTQYGLFRGDLLRETKFIEEGVFGEAGWGAEDDYLHHEMTAKGYVSLAVDKPIYYHFAHSGLRELQKAGLETKMAERIKILEARWGKNATWSKTIVRAGDYLNRTKRLKPT